MNFLSFDVVTTLVAIIILFFINYKYGKGLSISLLLAFYVSIIIFPNLPYISFDTEFSSLIGFSVIFAITTISLWVNIKSHKSESSSRKLLEFVLHTASIFILFISVSINSMPMLQKVYNFEIITSLVEKIPYGIALIIPVIAILVTNRKSI